MAIDEHQDSTPVEVKTITPIEVKNAIFASYDV